jgi:hypothetical protein
MSTPPIVAELRSLTTFLAKDAPARPVLVGAADTIEALLEALEAWLAVEDGDTAGPVFREALNIAKAKARGAIRKARGQS